MATSRGAEISRDGKECGDGGFFFFFLLISFMKQVNMGWEGRLGWVEDSLLN